MYAYQDLSGYPFLPSVLLNYVQKYGILLLGSLQPDLLETQRRIYLEVRNLRKDTDVWLERQPLKTPYQPAF